MNIVTINEVSGILKVKKSTLYAWTEKRMMPFIKLNGVLRFDLDEVMGWIKSSKVLPEKVSPINFMPKKFSKKDINIIIDREVALPKRQCYDSPKRGNQTSQARKGGYNADL